MAAGLYIHIPFCLRKCPYCDFYSMPMDEDSADKYLSAVCYIIASGHFAPGEIDTIYFGGGTPSLFGAERLHTILNCAHKYYNISQDAEISLEANPSSAMSGIFRDLKAAGFNRVSIGAQSGSDTELEALGRPHTVPDTRRAVLAAYESGFENISADLMLAVPGQSMESLGVSINFLAELPLSHISAYILKIEDGTPYGRIRPRNLPDEDLAAELYLKAVSRLNKLGFEQYEISNFAKKDMKCRHNLKYWRYEPYLGIGPSAHSFLGGKRFYFTPDLGAFIKNPLSALREDGNGDGFAEYAMLRLRLTEGLDLNLAGKLYQIDTENIKLRAAPFLANGLARLDSPGGSVLSLTPEGFLLSNTIISALVF